MEEYIKFAESIGLSQKKINGVLYYVGENSQLTINQLSQLYHYKENTIIAEKKKIINKLLQAVKGKRAQDIPSVLKEYMLGELNSIKMREFELSHGRKGIWGKDLEPVKESN